MEEPVATFRRKLAKWSSQVGGFKIFLMLFSNLLSPNHSIMKKKIFTAVLLAISNLIGAQAPIIKPSSATPADEPLYRTHSLYRETSINTRRFKHSDLEALLLKLPSSIFRSEIAGKSNEGRNIYHITIGNGPIRVLLWSQMHGDESTATMALLDIFNFFAQKDSLDLFKKELLKQLTIHVIPMLNPDGAERFTRRNVQGIDINRDAQRLQTPEGQILKKAHDAIKPDWGFNLHDQSRYYGAGQAPYTASIAFLAPAYDYNNTVNEKRGEAMQLIGLMSEVLQKHIPQKIARYNDAFEPRAFGDNLQKWGTRTILIESGGLAGDPEKQELRRLNFVAILRGLEGIAKHRFHKWDLSVYEALPVNEPNTFHDLLLRELTLEKNGRLYTTDLAFRRQEIDSDDSRTFSLEAAITEIGDLSVFYGYEQVELAGYKGIIGKVYPGVLPNVEALVQLDIKTLLKEGYTDYQMAQFPQNKLELSLPVRLIRPRKDPALPGLSGDIRMGQNPSLLLERDGQLIYLIINGILKKLD